MCRRSVVLGLFVLTVGLSIVTSNALGQEGLIGYWKFDEASGTTAADSAGADNDGTLIGDGLEWMAGKVGGALLFPGEPTDARVEFSTTGMSATAGTVAMWSYLTDPQPETDGRYFFGHTTQPQFSNRIQIYMQEGTTPSRLLDIGLGGSHSTQVDIVEIPLEQWTHVAMTWDSGSYGVYVDGEEVATGTYSGLTDLETFANIGNDGSSGPYEAFGGLLDEVQIYDRALNAVEIISAMRGKPFPYASGPDPKDGAMLSDTWVNLTWRAGEFAVSHNVYVGDNRDDVDAATTDSDLFRGNQTGIFYIAGFPGYAYPDGLVPGTTYYWRIDEVNDADPNSPWKGPIWSFSVPPKTAYNPNPADGAAIADVDAALTWTPGYGAKLHTMYFGEDYDTVANSAAGTPVGTANYKPSLQEEKVYYWRVDEFDGLGTYKGDVWTFTTPGAISDPQPANGATDVAMAATLSWTAATNATSHQVYLGPDEQAVRSADTGSPEYKGSKTLGAESYDSELLNADTTYYWRVDEVYAGNTVKGPVWSFSVSNYLLVDDFESYTDDDVAGQAIWQTWIDGFGVADNGAQVGYLMPPYAEQTIVHGGSQSMPLLYENQTGVTNSEADMTLTTTRDWTAAGVDELSLWVRGSSANTAEPLYVAVSNSAGSPAIVADDDPAVATTTAWTQWRIPLQAFADQGINLSNVDKLAIGLGSKSGMPAVDGTGTIYVDDIRLYQGSN